MRCGKSPLHVGRGALEPEGVELACVLFLEETMTVGIGIFAFLLVWFFLWDAFGELRGMDMKSLVVGQKITVRSGPLFEEVTVDKVTETYVRVRFDAKSNRGDVMGFQYDGTQCGTWDWAYESDPRPSCTEFGPWRLELK
jgi:hypothetical protein